ncbi:hypothetical protein PYCC9005_001346 [Savitreella phatthalungensis]
MSSSCTSHKTRPRYFDIGVNALDDQFSGIYYDRQKHPPDLLHVWERSVSAGCDRWLITAGDLKDSHRAWRLCRDFHLGHPIHSTPTTSESHDIARTRAAQGRWYATAGIHPTRASTVPAAGPDRSLFLGDLVSEVQAGYAGGYIRAYGELGLDYDRLSYSPKDAQLDAFRLQLHLITTTPIHPSSQTTIAQALPLFLHTRASHPDFANILAEFLPLLPRRGVVHSFTGEVEELDALVGMGFEVGLNGCSVRGEESLGLVGGFGDTVAIQVETDAPWCEIRATHAGASFLPNMFPSLTPTQTQSHVYTPPPEKPVKPDKFNHASPAPVKGRNEPAYIGAVVHVIASVREVDPEVIAQAAYRNASRMFEAPDFPKIALPQEVQHDTVESPVDE